MKIYFEGHTQEVYSVAFSNRGRLLGSGSGDRTVRIWDMETGMQKVFEVNELEGITSVSFSPDDRLLVAGSFDTVVRIWDVRTGNLVERLKGHQDSIYSVAFTPDGKGIISASLDKTLKQWDISSLANGSSRREPLPPALTPSADFVGALPQVVDGGEQGSVRTMNFTGHKDYVISVAIPNDGQWIVSASKDRNVHFWDPLSGEVHVCVQGHKNSVISVDVSSSTGLFVTASGDHTARLCSYSR